MSRQERRYVERHQKQLNATFTPDLLIRQVRRTGEVITDPRAGKNIQYAIPDMLVSGLSVFFMQCASFLEYQERMEKVYGMNNARSLFGIAKIPTGEQMRNVLDKISPSALFGIFGWCFDQLIKSGEIASFKSELGYLLALDGTGHFSSATIHCKNCLIKTEKKTGKRTYYHSALTPVLVKPGEEHVLSLVPEYILPQDGDDKQDCENKACKRWLKVYGKKYSSIEEDSKTTALGDDLYSCQPVIEEILEQGLHFLLVCKRESHLWLYDWVDNLDEGKGDTDMHTFTTREWNGKSHLVSRFKYANSVPLREKDSILVNWCEITVTNEETGKVIYHNAFITDHVITEDNVAVIVLSGRTRWKVENENNNTLKTKGYHFEHNYGHGKEHLSSLLVTLILLAFLFHTLLDLTHPGYQKVRELIGARIRFFNDIKTLTRYSFYRNFEHLFSWMHIGLTKGQRQPNYALPPPLMYTS